LLKEEVDAMVRAEEMTGVMTVHVRFNGRSFDIPLRELNVAAGSSDRMFKTALAGYLDIAVAEFDGYVIERHESGNLTVRPEAVFG
jgi:hypothetical protein